MRTNKPISCEQHLVQSACNVQASIPATGINKAFPLCNQGQRKFLFYVLLGFYTEEHQLEAVSSAKKCFLLSAEIRTSNRQQSSTVKDQAFNMTIWHGLQVCRLCTVFIRCLYFRAHWLCYEQYYHFNQPWKREKFSFKRHLRRLKIWNSSFYTPIFSLLPIIGWKD